MAIHEKYPRMHYIHWTGRGNPKRRVQNWWKWFKNKNIILIEKLDGGNTCIDMYGQVFARSHGMLAKHSSFDYIKSRINRNWINYLIKNRYDIFGENLYAVHSIKYPRLKNWFTMFGVRQYLTESAVSNDYRWLSWADTLVVARKLNLPVPRYEIMNFEHERDFKAHALDFVKESMYGGIPEGFIVRTADSFIRDDFNHFQYKYVRDDFMNTIPEFPTPAEKFNHWTYNWEKSKLYKI